MECSRWFLKNLNTELSSDPKTPLPGIILSDWKQILTQMQAPTCSQEHLTTVKRWKQLVYKQWCTATTGLYLTGGRNVVLILVMWWINLENTMLRGKSQTQKATYCMSPFIWSVQDHLIHRDRKQMGSCRGLGAEGSGEWLLTVQRFPLRMGIMFCK